MSRDNVEIVRRGQDHFNRTGEPDFGLLDPDVVLDTSNVVFDRAVYRGHDGIREWMAHQREVWNRQRYEPEELIPVGEDRVLAYLRMVGIGRDGIEAVAHIATLTTLRDGRVTRVKAYLERSEALEAAGLSE